jgi:hypothetical protein
LSLYIYFTAHQAFSANTDIFCLPTNNSPLGNSRVGVHFILEQASGVFVQST